MAHSYCECFTVPETCPECSAATDLLIATRVARLPKHSDPFGIYRPQQHFLAVDLTVKLARADTKLLVFKCLSGSDQGSRPFLMGRFQNCDMDFWAAAPIGL
jgi:hypothetical protein